MATPQEIAEAVRRSKREILADVRSGRVPGDVRTFSRLHDYVDANEYGGLCEPDGPFSLGPEAEVSVDFDAAGQVQDQVHQWLVAGGIR